MSGNLQGEWRSLSGVVKGFFFQMRPLSKWSWTIKNNHITTNKEWDLCSIENYQRDAVGFVEQIHCARTHRRVQETGYATTNVLPTCTLHARSAKRLKCTLRTTFVVWALSLQDAWKHFVFQTTVFFVLFFQPILTFLAKNDVTRLTAKFKFQVMTKQLGTF